MFRRLVQITVFFSLLISCSLSFAQNSPATQVNVFHAFNNQGINPDLKVTSQEQGYCWVRSLSSMRPNAWRCMVGNSIHDPCFVNFHVKPDVAVCVTKPWETSVTTIQLTKPLPKVRKVMKFDLEKAQPWFVELANGSRCQYLTGGTGAVDRKRLNYGCDQANSYILGDLDKTNPTWSAEVYNVKTSSKQMMPVKAVWY